MSKLAQLLGLAVAVALGAGLTARAADELKPGDTLDQTTWQKAEGLLPPEILEHYKKNEYVNRIADWPASKYTWPPDFHAGTDANEGKFKLGERGDILEKESGKQPPYILGRPFPTIDPSDPGAGVKIVWNYFYQFWYFGNIHAESQVNWISPSGLERRTDNDVRFLYYDGVPVDERPANPQNFLTQQLILVRAPADLNGTAALTWRYRDPGKRDSTWTYVPALRRVRAVSPANRSDGFLGSDMSQDDAHFFDGKPEDFVWTVKGEEDVLRLADPFSLNGEFKRVPVPGGGWRGVFKRMPMVGFQDPAWKGSPWAPLNFVLAKRRCWVIEGVPKDKYYLYGRIQLYIDKETYHGSYNRKFDWKGNLLNTYNVFADLNGAFEDSDYYGAGNIVYQGAENLRLNRATVMSAPQDGGDPANDRRIRLEPAFFDAGALVRLGK